MISENDKIETGFLKIQPKAVPPLQAGTYTLKAKIDLEGITNVKEQPSFKSDDVEFQVLAPRYKIEPGLIHSVYPLEGSAGAYSNSLPHIVFNRKTIPWERTISGGVEEPEPWMALLLLSDEEVKQNQVEFKAIKAGKLTAGDAKTVVPAIETNEWQKDDEINIMELPLTLFKNICPTKEELPFLCHTRQVDMSLKENAGSNPKGWFSVVVGHRLPQDEKPNLVFLVSLEGHNKVLTEPAQDGKNIRLVVLNQWAFLESGKTFGQLIQNLLENIGPFRIETASEDSAVEKALEIGYMPINHHWRNGKKSVCWYRGPLVPVSIPIPEKYRYENADEALRFDYQTGMFDISYAAAWQLGRLLALQQKGFTTALMNWKSVYNREKPLKAAETILELDNDSKPKPGELEAFDELVHDFVSDEILTDFILEWWNNDKS